ncbi:uncharacterized protein LOC129900222 [Solanum dulcamara]|uniref:uncharacterized protein LOC129873829 n=1 Tax=Solanum dulcamara TaxID=45834 RepID=UPI002486C99C|nr:uncharacterized protein LOC129873829 [Solanum dulcamara]XP_055831122.1 uncharacterized protein LOC129900222 [Solanum dulcamara]
MESVHGLKQSTKNQRILVSPGSDSSWEGYDEVRSKHRNDPTVMNKLREKLKSKATVKHAPKEIDNKIEGVTTRPNLPKGMKYVIKKIPSHPLRFGMAYRANFLDDFESSIGGDIVLRRPWMVMLAINNDPKNTRRDISPNQGELIDVE